MKTTARFTLENVRHDKENENHLVVSLTAPKKDWEKERPPVCVFPVVDVSTSMGGQKLDYAKKSALKLVEHLQPGDYAGLAIFHNGVDLISAPAKMTKANKDRLTQRIGDLHCQGCTNFSGGMLMGLEQLNGADVPKDLLLRVIMLTDGQANRGVAVDHSSLSRLLTENLGKATMSCFGYGEGANQELLVDLAKIGKGNYAFIQNPDDALSAFAKELGGLLSTYAQNIEVEVTSNNGHEIVEVISDVDTDGDEKKATIKLPEILSEEDRQLVVKVKLSEQTKALPRKMAAFDVKVSYDVVTETGKLDKKSETLKAKVAFVKPGKEDLKPDKDLDKIVGLAEALQAQLESEKLANAGNYVAAMSNMRQISDSFGARGLEGLQGYAGKIGSKMSDRYNYTSNSSYLSSTKSMSRRSRGTSGANKEAAVDAVFFQGDGDNSAQRVMKGNFADKSAPAPAPGSKTTTTKTTTTTTSTTKNTDKKVKKSSVSKSRSDRW